MIEQGIELQGEGTVEMAMITKEQYLTWYNGYKVLEQLRHKGLVDDGMIAIALEPDEADGQA